MNLSKRVRAIAPSATLAMTARAKSMQAAGIDVLSMSAGEPDFNTPDNIGEAAHAAIRRGDTRYTPVSGTAALRQAVGSMVERMYGQKVKPAQVIVGCGGKQVLFNACAALLDPGDEAMFAAPFWVSYPDMIGFAGGISIPVSGLHRPGLLPLAEDFAKSITPRTRLLILNSPSNPTGATYSREQLTDLAALLRRHPQIVVITDDIYSELVYDAPFISFAHVAPDLADRILIVAGVSKTYAMTGWRIGFGIGPSGLIAAMDALQGACTSGASSIAQAAAAEALVGDQGAVHNMRRIFKERRDRIVAGLRQVANLEVFAPSGAFYVFPKIRAYCTPTVTSSDALCEHLLESVHLAIVPGSAFGSDDHVRLSFACSERDIDAGIQRLQTGLQRLQ